MPARFDVAISALDLAPDHRVLEFGCGTGVLASRVAERLTTGTVTAIDRSATAVERALTNAPHVRLLHADLADFTSEEPFDRIVGVNVNLFWTGPCEDECEVLRSVLAPDGMVVLVYETPGAVRPEIVDRASAALESAGFTTDVLHGPQPTTVVIRARIP